MLYQAKQIKPTHIVQIGDLYDQYCFSRFTRKNLALPEQELQEGRESAVALWNSLYKTNPGAKRYQILGNHDIRLIKRCEEKLPEAQTLIREKVMELYQFKGVTTIEDDRDILKISGIAFHHGYLSKLGDHMRRFGSSAVVGHSHTGGTVFEQRNGEVQWELNCGYLANEDAEPLRYNPSKSSKWTLGYGLIVQRGKKLVPSFITV